MLNTDLRSFEDIAALFTNLNGGATVNDFGLNGPKVDFAIVAEPTLLQISIAHKGQLLTKIARRIPIRSLQSFL